MRIKLVVGLGNPGNIYNKTRHNAGFMAIDRLLKKYEINNLNNKFDGLYGEKIINDTKYIFLKPQKYINLSGEVIRDFVKFYKISLDDILVICDDLDLRVGSYKIKPAGSSGGHNGLKNIELMLNSKEYKRIKIGISNNKLMDTKDYVLGKFSDEEYKLIAAVMDIIENIFEDYINISFSNLMTKYNKKQ